MADWKYTIPVLRAEEAADGKYLVGEASGPERDLHQTEMSPEAITDFAAQIAERVAAGDPIPYVDAHAKDGVMRVLGHVIAGSVTPDFHLVIRVKLDDLNPAAQYLWNSVTRGKQFGMSIGGNGVAHRYVRTADGNRVIRFTKVLLQEISNTTRPSWVPSFGTVLARSVDTGVNEVSEELTRDEETTAPEAAPAEETTEVATSDEQTETPVENAAPEPTDEVDTTDDEVERARIAKRDAEALKTAMLALIDQINALGINVEDHQATPETPEPTTVENSDTGAEETVEMGGIRVQRDIATAMTAFVTSEIERAVAPLKDELTKRDAYIEELLRLPAGKVPAPVVREKFDSEMDRIKAMSPEDRLRESLSHIYGDR